MKTGKSWLGVAETGVNMSLHSVLVTLGALLPSAGVAFLFYVVIKAMLEGDRSNGPR